MQVFVLDEVAHGIVDEVAGIAHAALVGGLTAHAVRDLLEPVRLGIVAVLAAPVYE
ncbi:MAG: hypothetical protein MJZ22_04830 [Candidatus Saccharibacteria bacterium]|nr:hypothetical protein [Candidatus Saccharibacteria bacterium]